MKKLSSLLLIAGVSLLTGCSLFHHGSKHDKPSGPDEVSFSSLSWNYGGFEGKNCKLTDAKIGNLSASGNNMSYKWISGSDAAVKQLNSKSKDNPDLLACLFVKKSDGKWVGGKFEWISVSRTTRAFGNINSHYAGWSLSGVPNPCDCAFVVVNPNTKVRTNVIKGVWKR